MAIGDFDDLSNSIANKTQLFEYMKSFASQAIGQFYACHFAPGLPGAPTYPAPGVNGVAVDNSTSGAWDFTNPTGGDISYLSHLDGSSTATAGTFYLYDRLWHNSGLSTTTVGAQSITPAALTRYTSGEGVEAWFDVLGTAMGSGATAPSISYTDQAGNTGNTATAQGWVTTAAINRCFPFALAAGDTGVRSIQSFNNNASHTSGAFGLVLRKRLATFTVPLAGSGPDPLDFFDLGGPQIFDDACLEFLWQPAATTASILMMSAGITQG